MEAFDNGANAMQGKIATWLAINGHSDLASKVLNLTIPKYSEPEHMTIR